MPACGWRGSCKEGGAPSLLAAGLLLAALVLALAGYGCAPAPQDAGESSSTVAEEEQAPSHDEVSVRVAAPVALQGALEELADAYGADKEWLSFDVQVFESAKKQNKALDPAPEQAAADGDEDEDAGGDAAGDAAASGDGDEAAAPPKADIVFQSSVSAMDAAEEQGIANPKTRSDMLEDRLVLAVAADAPVSSFTTADLAAGVRPLALLAGKGATATRQRQVLESLGLYADGAYAGFYANAPDAVREFQATANLFATLSSDESLVALVRTSDLYRYGGVKAVGAVSPQDYSPLRFPQALGANLDALENGEAVEDAARGFLSWMATDEEALGIIEKWGLRLSA